MAQKMPKIPIIVSSDILGGTMLNLKKQRGFTLIEIAVVLIIIGLLLGGILKGQELINSARARNLADQSSAVQAAYYAFIDRYRQIPGDMKGTLAAQALGVDPSIGGNGNGQIDEADFDEASAVWAHFAAAGLISGSYPGTAGDAGSYQSTDPLQAPANPFGGRLLLARTDDYRGTATARLNLVLGKNIPVNVAREIDVKLDDGDPEKGALRAAKPSGAGFGVVAQGVTECTATGTPVIWNVAGDEQDCNAVSLY